MRKLTILFALLTLSVGLWAQDSRSKSDAIITIKQAAADAITEIQNASSSKSAKSIQDEAILSINQMKDFAIAQIKTAEERSLGLLTDWALTEINTIKNRALADINNEYTSGAALIQLDSVYGYNDDELTKKIYYTYNEEGVLVQRFFSFVYMGIDMPYILSDYGYNEDGILTSLVSYKFAEGQEGKWQKVLNYELMRQYDDKGQLIKETSSEYGDNDVVYGRVIYQYDENGNVIELEKYESTKEGDVIIVEGTTITEFTYNDKNQLVIEKQYFVPSDSPKYLEHTITYTYNEMDQLAEYVQVNEKKDDEKMLYQYDNYDLIAQIKYVQSGEEWKPKDKEEYTYDEHVNSMQIEEFVYLETEWVPQRKKIDVYNEQGWLETEACYKYEGSYKLYYIDEYTYDDYGNQLSLVSTDYVEGEVLGVTKYDYFYSDPSTDLMNANSKLKIQNSKFIKDDQLFIRRDGKLYNAIGMQIQ